MSDTQAIFPALREVPLEAIERELDNMWREHNASVARGTSQAYSRNSVLTLVAFTQGPRHARQVLEAIHSLTVQHPSRAIIISADPADRGSGMRAHIGTYVAPDSSSYGEDLVVEAQTEAVRHLPGVVLPLIVSGLPSFLWWLGEPPWGSELLEALVDGCDRFIVDTSEMSHVARSVSALEDLMRRKKTRCAVGDISWAAQAPWRDIVAQFFDPPEAQPYLEGIERVVIEYAAGDEDAATNSSQASLFAGWLASRLGWRIDPAQKSGLDSSRQYTLRSAADSVIVLEIIARFNVAQRSWWEDPMSFGADAALVSPDGHRQDDVAWVRHGALMSVHLASRLGGPRATFAVARERDLMHATTLAQLPEGHVPSKTVHLQSVGEQAPLTDQLQELGHDVVYEDALTASALLLRSSARRGPA
jgi:glucose-6-phosphate dehydrogenase assembly protein OpcA